MGSCVSSLHNNKNNKKINYMSSEIDNQLMSSSSIEKSSMPPTPVKDKPTNTDDIVVVDHRIVSFGYKSKVSPFNSVSAKRNSLSSNRSSFGGSKDEAFYDTQGWLDSDCDDDFYSVNGDFTPRGNTPVHPAGTPRLSRVYSPQLGRAVLEGKLPIRNVSNRSRGGTPVHRSFSSTTQENGPISEDVDGPTPNPILSPIATKTPKKSKKLAELFRESMRERGDIGLTAPLPPKPINRGPSGLRRSVSSSDKEIPFDDNVAVKEKPAKYGHRCFPRLGCARNFSESKKTSDATSLEDF